MVPAVLLLHHLKRLICLTFDFEWFKDWAEDLGGVNLIDQKQNHVPDERGGKQTRDVPGVQGGQTGLGSPSPAGRGGGWRGQRCLQMLPDLRQVFAKAYCKNPPQPAPISSLAPPVPSRYSEPKDLQGLSLLPTWQERMFYFLHTEEKCYGRFIFNACKRIPFGAHCFLCLWCRRGLLMLFCMQRTDRLLNI